MTTERIKVLQRILAILVAILCSQPSHAQVPLLRTETGMHTGEIRRISADESGRYLLSIGNDTTIRIWDLIRGRLLKTLRPTVTEEEALLEAATISTDGKMLAFALRQKERQPGSETPSPMSQIYLMDWRQDRVLKQVGSALPQVHHLALNKEGKRLAVALGSGEIRLHDTQTGNEIGQNSDSQSPCQDLDFDRTGRLLSSSEDGTLRLFDTELRQLRKTSVAAGKGRLQRARFSPDGKKLVLGYSDAPRVDVYSAEDLSFLYSPSMMGVEHGNLRLVAWSQSGSTLYAAGDFKPKERYVVRRWTSGGQGSYEDLPATTQPLVDLVALPQDGLAFAAQEPCWGVLGANGTVLHLNGAGEPVFLDKKLGLDRAGSRLRLRLAKSTASATQSAEPVTVVFSVLDRTVTINPSSDPQVSDSSEIAPSFTPPPGTLAVSASGDGRVIVTRMDDGTLRFHSSATGRQFLSLLLHSDLKRWIVWTPAGYFDASVGGEDLLGWQVGRAKGQSADFFRVGLLRDRFHRPDVIARVLFTRDEQRALEEANAESHREEVPMPITRLFPPIVSILAPVEQSLVRTNTLQVSVAVRSPSGEPVTAVRALVHGRLTQVRDLFLSPAQKAEADPDANVRILEVTIPSEDSTVAVVAETRFAKSDPAILHLRWGGTHATAEAAKPELFLLAVGTSLYRQNRLRLEYPAKDAQDISAALKAQEGKRYQKVETRLLTNEQATRSNILEGLSWLRQKTKPGNIAVLFLAGHGVNDMSDGKYYYLPHDADPAKPAETMVDAGQMQSFLSTVPGMVLLFIDTCHSGNVLGPQRTRSALDLTRLINELSSVENGVVVYAASTSAEVSRESLRWGNGAFTKAVVEGLRGKADYSRTGRITVSSLDHYISNRVKELTQEEQTPTTAKPSTVPDFLIATVPPPRPLHKKAWFWGTISAGVAVLAAGAAGIAVAATPKVPQTDGGIFTVTFD